MCFRTCVLHTGRLQRSKLPPRRAAHKRLVRNNIPLFVSPSDSAVRARRTSPAEHSKPYDPSVWVCVCAYVWVRGCSVLVYHRNDNCFRKFSPRPDATTMFTMSNHDRFDVPPIMSRIVRVPRCQSYAHIYYYMCITTIQRVCCVHTTTTTQSNVMIIIIIFFHFSFFVNIAVYIRLISWGYSRYF